MWWPFLGARASCLQRAEGPRCSSGQDARACMENVARTWLECEDLGRSRRLRGVSRPHNVEGARDGGSIGRRHERCFTRRIRRVRCGPHPRCLVFRLIGPPDRKWDNDAQTRISQTGNCSFHGGGHRLVRLRWRWWHPPLDARRRHHGTSRRWRAHGRRTPSALRARCVRGRNHPAAGRVRGARQRGARVPDRRQRLRRHRRRRRYRELRASRRDAHLRAPVAGGASGTAGMAAGPCRAGAHRRPSGHTARRGGRRTVGRPAHRRANPERGRNFLRAGEGRHRSRSGHRVSRSARGRPHVVRRRGVHVHPDHHGAPDLPGSAHRPAGGRDERRARRARGACRSTDQCRPSLREARRVRHRSRTGAGGDRRHPRRRDLHRICRIGRGLEPRQPGLSTGGRGGCRVRDHHGMGRRSTTLGSQGNAGGACLVRSRADSERRLGAEPRYPGI